MMTRTDGHPGAGDGASAGAGADDPLQQPIMNIPVAVQCPVSPPAQPSPAQHSPLKSSCICFCLPHPLMQSPG